MWNILRVFKLSIFHVDEKHHHSASADMEPVPTVKTTVQDLQDQHYWTTNKICNNCSMKAEDSTKKFPLMYSQDLSNCIFASREITGDAMRPCTCKFV